ncbi:MAG TPA: dihydroorotase [Candidatus Hydrogenedens sp.]|nr:dihydroorotase [Candidatus Hydrogenedens sp.]HOL20583.1 dihydroorotase [Candidatus Hydrogenedens sp.]HPP57661.1 dihydroorotase [Candidatus Hydrogenedens sp.]
MRIVIRNGWVINPETGMSEKSDLGFEHGVITVIGSNLEGDVFIDADGMVVSPGFVDLHVHFREPGFESKETIASGARAAVHGGVTSVVTMPNTMPPIDNAGMVELVVRRAQDLDGVHIYPSACATKGREGKELTEMADLLDSGAVAVTDDGDDIESSAVLRYVLEYSRMVGLLYLAHCEDASLSEGGAMNEGFVSTKLGIPGIPREAEETRIERNIRLAKLADAPIHIQHVTTKRGVEIIREAKREGIKVTAETCPHYWMLTEENLENYNTNMKMNPPLRDKSDVEAIIEGLKDGTIDCIATDHAPHTSTEKNVPFQEAPFGVIGLETLLGCVITGLVKGGHISMEHAIRLLTKNPAGIIKINAGSLSIGSPADITIFDPNEEWVVTNSCFYSKSSNSPFIGMKLCGKVKYTFCCGKILYYDRTSTLPKGVVISPTFLPEVE